MRPGRGLSDRADESEIITRKERERQGEREIKNNLGRQNKINQC